ncbi:MFS general substrate transporter [Daldinia caldariorum]|uniref:MFS general substrate transporter n=1 Tax=Daldinia caldariorum TaxID=326644 RepID=UPI002007314D|nr:MFS general substrate transporter [Daldinia caldariorum]KAI1471653.1 MFS general substrate transporter [Daldinia caldariorum]
MSTSEAELQESVPTNLPEAPDGGIRAWLVIAGALCVFFSAIGFSNAFGVFEEYYLSHQLIEQSPEKVLRPAAVLFVFSIMMTSLCQEYWQFMLAQGVFMGTVTGFLQFPAMAALSQFFNKRRAVAMGIAVAGSSLGGIAFPMALSKMLYGTSLDFGWSVRIIGFATIPPLGFACFAITSRLPPRAAAFFIWGAFKEPKFILLTVALFFMFLGAFVPLFYIPTYAVSRGMSKTTASYLLAFANAASVVGRVILGMLADRFGRLNMFAAGGFITSLVIFFWNMAESTPALIACSVGIGFTTGTVISGGSAAFTEVPKDPRDLGTYIGMGMGLSSIATLIGPPINGVFVSK